MRAGRCAALTLWLLVPVAAGACGGGGNGGGGGGGNGTDDVVDGDFAEFIEAYCEFSDRCAGELGRAFSSADGCIDLYSCFPFEELFQSLGFVIDEVALAACVEELRTAGCRLPALPGPCSEVLGPVPGAAGEGEACGGFLQPPTCGEGLYCHFESDCSVCRRYAGEDEDCSVRNCDEDLFCDATDVCRAPGADGQPCQSTDECRSGACTACEVTYSGAFRSTSCSGDGTCYEPASAGQPCTGGEACSEFLVCSEGVCSMRGVDGDGCTGDGDCVLDAWCTGGACERFEPCSEQSPGERCSGSLAFFGVSCTEGAYCDDGVDPPVCAPITPLGAPCEEWGECGADATCDFGGGVCLAIVPEGGSCADGEPCEDDTFCSADGLCTSPQPDGAACIGDEDCESRYCDPTDAVCAEIPVCPG